MLPISFPWNWDKWKKKIANKPGDYLSPISDIELVFIMLWGTQYPMGFNDYNQNNYQRYAIHLLEEKLITLFLGDHQGEKSCAMLKQVLKFLSLSCQRQGQCDLWVMGICGDLHWQYWFFYTFDVIPKWTFPKTKSSIAKHSFSPPMTEMLQNGRAQ